jgi:hypothetical protein
MKALMRAAAFFAAMTLPLFANASTMQCAPYQSVQASFPSGATYTADAAGVVAGVVNNDIQSLNMAGCGMVGVAGFTLCGELLNANMNVTTDQPMNWFVPANQYYQLRYITARNASRTYGSGSAAGGFYTAVSKGGTAVVAASQAYTGLHATNATSTLDLTLVAGVGTLGVYTASPLILSLTTADGSAGTLDFFAYCQVGQ